MFSEAAAAPFSTPLGRRHLLHSRGELGHAQIEPVSPPGVPLTKIAVRPRAAPNRANHLIRSSREDIDSLSYCDEKWSRSFSSREEAAVFVTPTACQLGSDARTDRRARRAAIHKD